MSLREGWTRIRRGPRLWPAGLALWLCLATALAAAARVVDCVLAVVDNEVVTLLDLRVVKAFGLDSPEIPGTSAEGAAALLERVIDRKVVVRMARGQAAVTSDSVDAALRDLEARYPGGEFRTRLADFGLSPDDLKPYLEENLLFREIINQRFSRNVALTLKEIEAYYDQTYVPDRKAQGLTPEPLTQVLGEIEAAVRERKVAAQVNSWIKNLRRQAEVDIKTDCLAAWEEEKT
jgi:parvulin-like peptidyl-prolyl isomerase